MKSKLSLISAIFLAGFGVFRFSSDMLTDAQLGWHSVIEGSFLRYLVRAPSDGTLAGDINIQFMKILAVPCGIAGLFLLKRLFSSDIKVTNYNWHQKEIRMLYVGMLFVAFTLMEIEKATHFFGLQMAGLLTGEQAWLNHALHVVSAVIGWYYMRWLSFIPRRGNWEPTTK